ncbi:hypothetical protein [Georgenia satyanarayanai]|uniref:hypothetical protein n=1 Tax=Georgenia satyanarayanai TaxID=860221 RepID=UPI0012642ADB|nr:hypothetical protein [Georgenia satyanarayanai]
MDVSAAAPDTFRARWEAALAELELDVAETEAMLAGDHVTPPAPPWVPPSDLGPLPEPLRERAQVLLDRQTEVAQRLSEALVLSRRQARLTEVLRAGGPRRPVYVDAAG